MSGYESFARSYIYDGLFVIPYGQGGHPNVKDYSTPGVALNTIEDFDAHYNYNWRYGVGIVLSLSNLVMVDIDMHDPERENGLRSWDVICQRYGEDGTFPETWRYSTPRGGRHLLYRRPEDFPRDFSTGFMAPGVELKVNVPTPMPPTPKWKKTSEDKAGKPRYERTKLVYQWMWNDAGDPEDWFCYRPGNLDCAELPEWLTNWARYPKVPLLSDAEYEAMTGYTPPIVRTKGASVYERFLEKHQRQPEIVQELWTFHRVDLGALAILDGVKKKEKRDELYRTTGSTRTTRMYTLEQVQEIIDTHNLDVVGKPKQSGRSLITWDLRECPLERDRREERADGHKKGSEGNATISYDTQTSTPMFFCFEGKCRELVEYEYDGIWWNALLASLGVVERLTGEEVLQHMERGEVLPTPTVSAPSKAKKSVKKVEPRKDERGFPIGDCRNGLTPPWESNSEEARTTRLAALDAEIEKQFIDAKNHMRGRGRTIEERIERNTKLNDPHIDPTTTFTTEEDWTKWNKECWLQRHLPACYFCDVPVDVLQERLDRRFPISNEEREYEHARIETFFNYYALQTTKED